MNYMVSDVSSVYAFLVYGKCKGKPVIWLGMHKPKATSAQMACNYLVISLSLGSCVAACIHNVQCGS